MLIRCICLRGQHLRITVLRTKSNRIGGNLLREIADYIRQCNNRRSLKRTNSAESRAIDCISSTDIKRRSIIPDHCMLIYLGRLRIKRTQRLFLPVTVPSSVVWDERRNIYLAHIKLEEREIANELSGPHT